MIFLKVKTVSILLNAEFLMVGRIVFKDVNIFIHGTWECYLT
jgi:hypothetical protein